MDILMSETCWAHKKWNKIASDITLVFHSSTVLAMSEFLHETFRTFKNSRWKWVNFISFVQPKGCGYFVSAAASCAINRKISDVNYKKKTCASSLKDEGEFLKSYALPWPQGHNFKRKFLKHINITQNNGIYILLVFVLLQSGNSARKAMEDIKQNWEENSFLSK